MNNIRLRQMGHRSVPVTNLRKSVPRTIDNVPSLLSELSGHMKNTSFGGSLLSKHLSINDVQNVLKPALRGIKAGVDVARHKTNIMDLQKTLADKIPDLKNSLENGFNVDMNKIKDPFENMDNRQLYHHAMQLGHNEWNKVKEVAGQIAGKHPSKFGSHDQMPEVLRHVRNKYKLGGSVHTGGTLTGGNIDPNDRYKPNEDFRPHFADISVARHQAHAAQRLEHVGPNSQYPMALRASLYGAKIAPLSIKHGL